MNRLLSSLSLSLVLLSLGSTLAYAQPSWEKKSGAPVADQKVVDQKAVDQASAAEPISEDPNEYLCSSPALHGFIEALWDWEDVNNNQWPNDHVGACDFYGAISADIAGLELGECADEVETVKLFCSQGGSIEKQRGAVAGSSDGFTRKACRAGCTLLPVKRKIKQACKNFCDLVSTVSCAGARAFCEHCDRHPSEDQCKLIKGICPYIPTLLGCSGWGNS
jgi:hypothetical protein